MYDKGKYLNMEFKKEGNECVYELFDCLVSSRQIVSLHFYNFWVGLLGGVCIGWLCTVVLAFVQVRVVI